MSSRWSPSIFLPPSLHNSSLQPHLSNNGELNTCAPVGSLGISNFKNAHGLPARILFLCNAKMVSCQKFKLPFKWDEAMYQWFGIGEHHNGRRGLLFLSGMCNACMNYRAVGFSQRFLKSSAVSMFLFWPQERNAAIYWWKPYVFASFLGAGSCERFPRSAALHTFHVKLRYYDFSIVYL